MLFSSLEFIFLFLPLVVFCYFLANYLIKGKKISSLNLILLLFSLFFYVYGERKFYWVMLLSATIDFWAAKQIGKIYAVQQKSEKATVLKARTYLLFSLISNLGLLGYFKYVVFLSDFWNQSLAMLHLPTALTLPPHLLHIVLPIGISFYTFQSLSYTIDVYRKNVSHTDNFIDFMCYISFFPQLIAGPIVRYIDLQAELKARRHDWDTMAYGAKRFILGLSKKVIIANPMGYYADYLFALQTSSFDSLSAWIAAISYTLQIYFDFSGYSDMAIGMGKIFGFHFPENFNYPYIARSIQDFWRRWHISLSTWFRDYLYIPLGGNRRGRFFEYRNLLLVFFLCGLWHGANYTFILWGLYHGFFLILERLMPTKFNFKFSSVLAHLYVLLIVPIGWILFRAESVSQASELIQTMLGLRGQWYSEQAVALLTSRHWLVFAVLGMLCSLPLENTTHPKVKVFLMQSSHLIVCFFWMVLLALATCFLAGQEYNPFIYFRF